MKLVLSDEYCAGICRDDICNRCNGIHCRSCDLPQNSERLPFQSSDLLCTALVQCLRDARSHVRPTLELSPRNPRLLVCSAGRMCVKDHQQDQVDADDGAELSALPSGHRGHVFRPLDVHRQFWCT